MKSTTCLRDVGVQTNSLVLKSRLSLQAIFATCLKEWYNVQRDFFEPWEPEPLLLTHVLDCFGVHTITQYPHTLGDRIEPIAQDRQSSDFFTEPY